MKRVYVAGAYSADNVLAVLDNMRRGIRLGTECLLVDFALFVPWLDHHLLLILREGESLSVEDFYRYTLKWLEVADAVLVVPGYENSKCTLAEIARAEELDIPVFYHFDGLESWANGDDQIDDDPSPEPEPIRETE